jgi:Bifunctional DNA primase/polymerase, N-terminal
VTPDHQARLDAALATVEGGIPVFPCRPDKTPFTAHGFHDASLDPDQVRYWWARWVPGANIGVPTGQVSGLVAVDIDCKHEVDGFASWTALMTELGVDYHPTFSHVTPTGGFHWFYEHPGVPVTNTVGLVPGVDIRGDGGYVLIPPSTGIDGGAYEVEHDDVDWFAPLPGPLLELLARPAAPAPPTDPLDVVARLLDLAPVRHASAYVDAAFAGEVQRVMDAAPGTRNPSLNKAAYNLGRIPDTDDLEVEHALLTAAEAVGLVADDGNDQCLATIRSGLNARRRNPRHR